MRVLINVVILHPETSRCCVCEKEIEMPVVFVGLQLVNHAYGLEFKIDAVTYDPHSRTLMATIEDDCDTLEEFTQSVEMWKQDGYVSID